MKDNTYTLYWLTGERQLVYGSTIASAMNNAGIGNGALRALDFYAVGDDKNYTWNGKKWTESTPLTPNLK